MAQLDVKQVFNRELAIPNINTHRELGLALKDCQAFENDADLTSSLNQLSEITGTDQVGVGIKNVLMTVGQAKRDRDNFPGTFAEMMAQQMANTN